MTRPRRRQAGAETVEFALTLVLWFTVFLIIVNMAIAMYNKGAVTNAARYAARQGSLYWVDPANYSDLTPTENKRLKDSMITSAVNYWASTVIALGRNSVKTEYNVTGLPSLDCISWAPGCFAVADASVEVTVSVFDPNTVTVSNPGGLYSFLGLDKLLGAAWSDLNSQTASNSEARL